MTVMLPSYVRVVVRDWLNANQVMLLGRCPVLIDTGYGRDAEVTLRRLRAEGALGSTRPELIVNTHCHSDHMGGNALLARHYASPIAVPAGERAVIDAWNEEALWLSYADQRCERFQPQLALEPGAVVQWGEGQWQALPAPGHDMHALMFWCEDERVLLTGDALWESGFGVVLPGNDREERLKAARDTLHAIARLSPRIVIPGHGRPFREVGAALDRALARLDALAADEMRMVRAALKTMFAFSLLDRRRFPLETLAQYLAAIPLYRDYDARYLGYGAGRLAAWLCEELTRAGVAALGNGHIEALAR